MSGMKAHLMDTHLLVPRSRSSAKIIVKYQGHISQNMTLSGASVFNKHILCFCLISRLKMSGLFDTIGLLYWSNAVVRKVYSDILYQANYHVIMDA